MAMLPSYNNCQMHSVGLDTGWARQAWPVISRQRRSRYNLSAQSSDPKSDTQLARRTSLDLSLLGACQRGACDGERRRFRSKPPRPTLGAETTKPANHDAQLMALQRFLARPRILGRCKSLGADQRH